MCPFTHILRFLHLWRKINDHHNVRPTVWVPRSSRSNLVPVTKVTGGVFLTPVTVTIFTVRFNWIHIDGVYVIWMLMCVCRGCALSLCHHEGGRSTTVTTSVKRQKVKGWGGGYRMCDSVIMNTSVTVWWWCKWDSAQSINVYTHKYEPVSELWCFVSPRR